MKVRKIPRGTFLLGAFATVALGLPLTVMTLGGVARRLGVGDVDASPERLAILSAIFAGLPTWLAGGGVARLVAHRMAERAWSVGRGVTLAAVAMSVVGVGIVTLTAVPAGGLPENPVRWAPLLGAGLLVGAVTGAAVGVLVAMRQRRHGEKKAAA